MRTFDTKLRARQELTSNRADASPHPHVGPRHEARPISHLHRVAENQAVRHRCSQFRTSDPELPRPSTRGRSPCVPRAMVQSALRAPGQPLDVTMRALVEPRFGRDLSHVRVHTDGKASNAARALGARAYTVGRHMVFGAGQYAPRTAAGLRLLTHELTHTIQQGATAADPTNLCMSVTRPHGRAERNARSVERAFVRGARLPTIDGRPIRIARQETDAEPVVATQPVPVQSSALRTVKIWMNAFIPKDIEGLTKAVPTREGETMIEGPTFASDCFLTDQRGFDSEIGAHSRMHSEIEINVLEGREMSQFHECDPTEEVDCEDGDTECKKTCDKSRMKYSSVRVTSQGMLQVDLEGAANNPCFSGSPDINYRGTVTVDPAARTVGFDGKIDEFPAFEMYAATSAKPGMALFQEFPPKGNAPGDLFGSANREVKAAVKIE